MNYTLGLDMGVASLGWAVVSEEDQFIDSGVRVFPAGIDKFGTGKDTHLNQERRKARGARRRILRKAKRKALIRKILTELSWIPTGADELAKWENFDVYELRSRALLEKISLPEFARILLHLNQRRGFLSLRKSEVDAAEGDDKKKLEGMLGEISALQSAIDDTFPDPAQRTLGNYLYKQQQNGYVTTPKGKSAITTRIRARHIRRAMLYHEFDLIWNKQASFHPELTNNLRYGTHGKQGDPIAVAKPVKRNNNESLLEQFGLENLTFFQRRVYWPTSSIGQCEHEEGELRAPIADRRFQEFRMLSELNNLRLFDHSADGKPVERKLTDTERETATSYLSATQKPSLSGLKKKIAKLPDSPEVAQISFNLEKEGRDNIGGLPTDLKLAKAFGAKKWQTLDEDKKNRIVEILTMPESGSKRVIQRTDDETEELLEGIDGLTSEQIHKLLRIALPNGYCNFSTKALEKLLPHIRKGYVYQAKGESSSALHLAGYKRRDESASQMLDKLPLLSQLNDPKSDFHDRHFPHVNNPLVLRSLHELRKVVNALVKKYGPPTAIHLEMARDLKMSTRQRTEHAQTNNKHKKARKIAAEKLEKAGIAPTRDAVLLHRLWEEQNKLCIYSGEPISFGQLVGGDVDIDHIYPRRANDDSYMNKVVCFSQENRAKGDRLPIDWLGEGSEKFQAIAQRAQALPYPKRKRLLAEKIPEDFAARDATDTAYMTRVARHYLTYLVEHDHQVLCLKGRHTSFLRKRWGLNGLLRNDLLDLKNREDHRHHALDAIILAVCDRKLLQRISKELTFKSVWGEKLCDDGVKRRIYRLKPTAETLNAPWENFAGDAANSLNSIWVSHRPSRKVSGPLHEETNYGPTAQEGVLVRRKKLIDLKDTEIKKIRDPEVKRVVQDYLEKDKRLYRSNIGGKAFQEELDNLFAEKDSLTHTEIEQIEDKKLRTMLAGKLSKKNPLQDAERGEITLPSGIPIKKVRLLVANKAAIPLRPSRPDEYIIPGNTHHLAIFSLGDSKYHFEPVTLLEAARRKKQGGPIVDETPPNEHPTAEFFMDLCYNDSIRCEIDGIQQVFIFKGVHATQLTAKFVHHLDARKNNEKDPVTGKAVSIQRTCGPNTLEKNFSKLEKIDVLPTGECRILTAATDYGLLSDQLYIEKSPANSRRLKKSIEQIESGGGSTRELPNQCQ